jgi:hypothetical protein
MTMTITARPPAPWEDSDVADLLDAAIALDGIDLRRWRGHDDFRKAVARARAELDAALSIAQAVIGTVPGTVTG